MFDSNGPTRIRGTAQQLFEKYSSSAATRPAVATGAAEGYQHAEHYFRILNAMAQAAQQGQGQGQQQNGQQRRPYNSEEGSQSSGDAPEEAEVRAPGTGDQPEAREIPIAAAPPEG